MKHVSVTSIVGTFGWAHKTGGGENGVGVVVDRSTDITLDHVEVSDVYGGFGLAIAGVLAYAAIADGELRTGILVTVGAALAGMAFGRLLSAVLGGRTAFYPNWFYFGVEAVAGAALLITA